jgi:Flp pilus assembly protein CpaB
VSRRTRALVFLAAALVCAILAAMVAGRYRSRVDARYGQLEPVVVSTAELPAGAPIDAKRAGSDLAVRRVPASFVPPGALVRPGDALGRAPSAVIPSGSYLLDAQLVLPQSEAPRAPGVGEGLRPVEVAVAGAEALTVGDGSPEGSRVDVVVSRQGGLGRSAQARIAATGVRLLALQSPPWPSPSSRRSR